MITREACRHTLCIGAAECIIHAGRPAPKGWACCSSNIGPACQHRTDPKGWTREIYLADQRPQVSS